MLDDDHQNDINCASMCAFAIKNNHSIKLMCALIYFETIFQIFYEKIYSSHIFILNLPWSFHEDQLSK